MRPIYHPHPDEITVQGILYALSDPVRVRIINGLRDADCAQNCTVFAQILDRAIPKSTLSQHFKVLREAGLIRSERQGVEMNNVSRWSEIEGRFPGLIPSILNAYKKQLQEKPAVS